MENGHLKNLLQDINDQCSDHVHSFFSISIRTAILCHMVRAADTSQVACCSGRTLAATQLNVVRMRLREERAKGEKKKNEK